MFILKEMFFIKFSRRVHFNIFLGQIDLYLAQVKMFSFQFFFQQMNTDSVFKQNEKERNFFFKLNCTALDALQCISLIHIYCEAEPTSCITVILNFLSF